MPQSESIGKLADALAKAQAIMKPAKKEAENPFFKSKYADLASVWEAVREPLSKYGLSVVQLPQIRETPTDHIYLETRLLHASGEWISSMTEMKPTKNDPQAIGSCLTYARRYALAAITGVASEEDDDGQAASSANAWSAPTQQKASQAPSVKQNAAVLEATPVFETDEPPPPVSDGRHGGPAMPGPHEARFIWRLNGKHKGTYLEDLPEGYLKWAAENVNVKDHRAAAIMELDRRNGQEIFADEPELIEDDR